MSRSLLIGLCLIGLLAGCQSVPEAQSFVASQSQQGIVNWRGQDGTLTADLVAERNATGNVRLTAIKGMRLLTITEVPGGWVVEGPLVRRTWRGHPDSAPAELIGWLGLAEAYQAAPAIQVQAEIRTGRISAVYRRTGERVVGIDVVSVTTGERFRVRF